MDGNPAAGAETIREALDRARELALGRYRSDVRELAVALAMHRSLVEVSPELDESIARDERELPDYAGTIGRRSELEPYRRKLSFIWWRLGNDGYDRPAELLADLDVLASSLEANRGTRIAAGRLAALRRRVEIFGFHLAKLDVRLHADELREPGVRVRDALAAAADVRRRHGPAALDTVIVSGTTSAADVLRVFDLSDEPLSVVPLFETISDLGAAPARSSASSSPIGASRDVWRIAIAASRSWSAIPTPARTAASSQLSGRSTARRKSSSRSPVRPTSS